ncbi:MAG: calcium-translocating P-type ATPase, PMCA-type [Bacteroidales bacterium]|nr:calcium-translocating P-type ATPase, PMCA-type [Bacteroidales bacterium]
MNPFYNQNVEDILDNFNVSKASGLSSEEAKKRIYKYGNNKLISKKRKTFFRMFFEQFKSFMIIILLIAAIISGVVGVMKGEGMVDTFVILGILFLNAFIGAFQERKAAFSLEALKNLASPITKVLRDGEIKEIKTDYLVPGDIVILETGDIIPADLRLIEAINLKIQESSLTGESVPVEKSTIEMDKGYVDLGDRINMAFSSGIVTYGRGRGVVVETGMNTEVGKIAQMLQQTDGAEPPIRKRLDQLGKVLGIGALIICGVIFLVGVLYGNPILSMFMTAISLAVAAIPEGLPAISTVVFAIGVQRLVKRNAIIKTLPSVETLGSATVICSDKTGTLTQNKMTVVEAYVNHKKVVINRKSPSNNLNDEGQKLVTVSILCADARMRREKNGKYVFIGDPTETALLDFGTLYGINKDDLEKSHSRIAEIPFDSKRKRMATVNRMKDSSTRVNVKGGLDEVLSVCDRIIIEGKVRKLTSDDKQKITIANEAMANSALRVLAMAYKDLPEEPVNVEIENLENELIFIGILGMIDPARPEVIDAVEKCKSAGIRAIMITGDHKSTALAIAREIGIFIEGDFAITGAELEQLSEEEFNKNVEKYSVYARVAPEHKVRIVKAWQKHDEVVAMTGDGVNDAPALKQADIGAAMGIVGTDVAKGAADMVLTDDNFATIVSAIEEGRRIYDNILKAITFLISTNIGEVLLLLIASLFNWGTPLLPIQILWVNLVTDSLPALALSVDPAENNIMNRKPRNSKKGFMTKGMIWRVLYQGCMLGVIPLVAYKIGLRDQGESLGQTMAFSALIFAQLMHVRNLHSNTKLSMTINPLKNKPLIGAILVSAALALFVLLVPGVREAFHMTIMDGKHWWIVILMSLIPTIVVDIFKLLKINGSKNDY